MPSNDTYQWDSLVLERGASPLLLDDTAFRDWMRGRRIFVSSVMDSEMKTDRGSVRALIMRWGGIPVMWEAITPQDKRPEGAYLEGVETSSLFVLLLGSRYGVSDASGYSPTHKEANRARERDLPRLLFLRSEVGDADRAGKLNDWLRGLYAEVSGASYSSPEDLCSRLEDQLREMAAKQESLWLKLGPLVFPGRVSERRTSGNSTYIITARVRDGAVRRGLSSLSGMYGGVRADRLTWNTNTEAVRVEEIGSETTRASESAVTVTCIQSGQQPSNYSMLGAVTVAGANGGRSYGPSDQAELWANTAVFGQPAANSQRGGSFDMVSMFAAHSGPTLPEVLRAHSADGWLAEGLTRLFIVEHLIAKYGGHFDRLEVGPATANGIRVRAEFTPKGAPKAAVIEGLAPVS